MGTSKNKEHAGINPELLGGEGSLRNMLLIAMPGMETGVFNKSVVYICAHNSSGAMGLIINQRLPDIEFADLLSQLHLPVKNGLSVPVVHLGGPVETGRGFVLHSQEYVRQDTVRISDTLSMTGTVDILRSIAEGNGPRRSIFALGYAGWAAGQLEAEIQSNAWLTVPADDDLLFSSDLSRKWSMSLERLGINPLLLPNISGSA
jgi:putative transcriptional regulator